MTLSENYKQNIRIANPTSISLVEKDGSVTRMSSQRFYPK